MAFSGRGQGGLTDGTSETGLAEVLLAFVTYGGQLGGARQHGERVLFADAVESGDGFEHGLPSAVRIGVPFNPTGRQMQTWFSVASGLQNEWLRNGPEPLDLPRLTQSTASLTQ